MERVHQFLSLAEDRDVQQLYNELFMSTDIPVALVAAPKDIVATFIEKAMGITPQWTTTRCAMEVEAMTGTAMVAASAHDYSLSYLYSIALAAEVDLGTFFDLSDRQAEVSFKLCHIWKKRAGKERAPAPENDADAEFSDTEERLPWEEQREPLPTDLSQVLSRHVAGTLGLDAKSLLDSLPRWQNLKDRAESNNHRNDGQSRLDKALKSAQQRALSLLRVYAALHTGLGCADSTAMGQQFFALLLDFEKWLCTQRKLVSLPGCVEKSEPQLFSNEDLKVQAEVEKVNRAGTLSHSVGVNPRLRWCFPFTGYTGFKFRGNKFGNKGFNAYGTGFRGGRGWRATPRFNSKGKSASKGKCSASAKCSWRGIIRANRRRCQPWSLEGHRTRGLCVRLSHSARIGHSGSPTHSGGATTVPCPSNHPEDRGVMGSLPPLRKATGQFGLVVTEGSPECGGSAEGGATAPKEPPCLPCQKESVGQEM